MASRTEYLRAWALGPQTGCTSTSRLFHGPLPSAKPRHLFAFCRCAKGGACPIHMEGTYEIPNDDVAGTSGHFRELRPAQKMHGGPLTERGDHISLTLISCPLITERRTCRPVSVVHWAASRTSIATAVSEEHVQYLVSAPGWWSHIIDSLGSPLLFSHTAKTWICAHPTSSSLDHFRSYRHHQICSADRRPTLRTFPQPLESSSTLTHDPSPPS